MGVIQTQAPKSREYSRIFLFQHLSSIFLPQPYILLESVVNVTFVNPRVCEKFSAAAFACVMCDLGNYSNITANTHSLFCHASTFIQWAQMESGVSLGALTENSIEKGNRQNKLYRQLYCYHGDIKRENRDIFIRRLLVSDPFLVIEGEWK